MLEQLPLNSNGWDAMKCSVVYTTTVGTVLFVTHTRAHIAIPDNYGVWILQKSRHFTEAVA